MHLPDIYDDDRQEPEELLWGDDEPTPESESESESEGYRRIKYVTK